MNSEKNETLYVKLRDMAGNEFVCPLNELRDAINMSPAELENCFEGDVIGRYAGNLDIIETEN